MNVKDLKNQLIGLYKKAAAELPEDILLSLQEAKASESIPLAKKVLGIIMQNAAMAKAGQKPICQDTGVPVFYISRPKDYSESELRGIVEDATIIATEEVPLRPNALDSLSNKSLGNRPMIHFEESENLGITLLLKGGGSENVSSVYSLPDKSIGAGRDLDGVKKCVLDSVFRAQGRGCPPYIIGVAVGGSIEEVAFLSKKQLLRKISEQSPIAELAEFEKNVLGDVNKLGIGPMGLGGKTTALAVKAASVPRHPGSFFVGISFGCWCLRRQSL